MINNFDSSSVDETEVDTTRVRCNGCSIKDVEYFNHQKSIKESFNHQKLIKSRWFFSLRFESLIYRLKRSVCNESYIQKT